MNIQWTGRQTRDPENFSHVFQAMVDGQSVSVYVSQEAIDDYGEGACKAKAEQKLLAFAAIPKRVDVLTSDF